jgi:PKD repeat protein
MQKLTFILTCAITLSNVLWAQNGNKHIKTDEQFKSHLQIENEWLLNTQNTADLGCGTCISEKHSRAAYVRDSLICYLWDTTNNVWRNNGKFYYTYDADNLIMVISQTWNGSWQNSGRTIYSYNTMGKRLSYSYETWNGSWQLMNNETYTYDANGNRLTSIYENFDVPQFKNKDTYQYDSNNNLLIHSLESWNGSTWEVFRVFTYTYDTNNNKTSEIRYDCNGPNCQNIYKDEYTYDTNNNQTFMLHQLWNNLGGWVPYSRYNSTYNSNNLLMLEVFEIYSSTVWSLNGQKNYAYDSNNNLTELILEKVNGSVLVNYSRNAYTYDINNNKTSESYQTWDGTNWVYDNRTTYTYDNFNNQIRYLNERGSSLTNYSKCETFYSLPDCSALFTLVKDNSAPNKWFALNSASGTAPLTYTWYWGDGDSSTGAYPSHTYNTEGFYNICLTISDANGCSDTYCDASTYIFKKGAVITINVIAGVEELDNHHFSIYPNPTNNHLNITTTLQGKDDIEYQMSNTLGATIATGKAVAKDFSIDVRTLPSGIYFIHLQSGNAKTVKRFIKE